MPVVYFIRRDALFGVVCVVYCTKCHNDVNLLMLGLCLAFESTFGVCELNGVGISSPSPKTEWLGWSDILL
jgi:hypothetical protein